MTRPSASKSRPPAVVWPPVDPGGLVPVLAARRQMVLLCGYAGSANAGSFDTSSINVVGRIAASFAGSNYMTAAGFMPSGNNAWSVSFWVRTTFDKHLQRFGVLARCVTALQGMSLVISDDWGANFQFALNVPYTNAFYGSTSGALNDGNWHFCVAAYDGTSLFIYVDNVSQSFGSAGGPDWRGDLNISSPGVGIQIGYAADGLHHFNGELAEMYFWWGALTAADAAWLWNGGAGQPQPTSTIIASAITDCTLKAGYHFANNLNDFSGNGYNGSPVSGGPSYVSGTAFAVSQGSTSLDGGDITTDGGGNLTASGRISGKLNTTATASGGSAPSGGNSGDIAFDATYNKLWVKCGSTWRYANLT